MEHSLQASWVKGSGSCLPAPACPPCMPAAVLGATRMALCPHISLHGPPPVWIKSAAEQCCPQCMVLQVPCGPSAPQLRPAPHPFSPPPLHTLPATPPSRFRTDALLLHRWMWTTAACATCSRRASGGRQRTRHASCSSKRRVSRGLETVELLDTAAMDAPQGWGIVHMRTPSAPEGAHSAPCHAGLGLLGQAVASSVCCQTKQTLALACRGCGAADHACCRHPCLQAPQRSSAAGFTLAR